MKQRVSGSVSPEEESFGEVGHRPSAAMHDE